MFSRKLLRDKGGEYLLWVTADMKNSSGRRCAFCKHWFDPSGSAIMPVKPNLGLWRYDNAAIRRCAKDGMEHKGFGTCRKFESKV